MPFHNWSSFLISVTNFLGFLICFIMPLRLQKLTILSHKKLSLNCLPCMTLYVQRFLISRRISTVADPGFTIGEGGADLLGGCQPLMCTLFGKNICENERNGSCWGGGGGTCQQHSPWIHQ